MPLCFYLSIYVCLSVCLSRVFKRVLPLPNGNWNTIVDDWCCHPDPFAKKLLPRAEDCLLGDTFLLLARDDSCEQTLTQDRSPVGAVDSQDSKVSKAQRKRTGDSDHRLNDRFEPDSVFNGSSRVSLLLFSVSSSESLTLLFIITYHKVVYILPQCRC